MLLSTLAVRQSVDIFVTVCLFFCVFVRLQISPSRIKQVVSNFARRFIGVQGRESYIFVNFAPPEAQYQTNWPACGPRPPGCKCYRKRYADVNVMLEVCHSWNRAACGLRIGICWYTSIVCPRRWTYLFCFFLRIPISAVCNCLEIPTVVNVFVLCLRHTFQRMN